MKRFKDRKISLKLIILFITFPVVCILLLGHQAIRISSQDLISQIKESGKIEASSHLTAIDILLDKNNNMILRFANDAIFTGEAVSPEKMTVFLKERKEKYGYVSLSYFDMNRVRIADTEGRHLGEKYDLIGFWNDVLNGKISSGSDVRISDDLKIPVIFFASPVKNSNGRAKGVIVAVIDFKDIAYIIDGSSNEHTHSTLVDKDRNILYSNCEELKKLVLKDKIKEMPSVDLAILAQDGAITEYSPYHQKEFITTYMHEAGWGDFKGNDWFLISSIEKEIVLTPVKNLKNTIIGIVILIVFIIFLVTFFIVRFITKPIVELNRAAQKIKTGDLTLKAKVNSGDEIGQLAVVLNQMVDRLKESLDKIAENNKSQKEKVKDKTKNVPETQDAIIRSGRLAVLGQFASGIAHELKNPLKTMKNAVNYINTRNIDNIDPKIKENLDMLSKGIENSNNIINDILKSRKIEEPILKLENINMIINETLAGCKIPSNIEIVTELEDDLPCIEVDAMQIKQVFYNIIDNAVKAMEKGGKLTVSTSVFVYVVVSFQDTGTGVPKEDLEKIFQPLYTTRPDGTGLGLSVCSSVIEGHSGMIEVKSEADTGTKFTVKLPVERN